MTDLETSDQYFDLSFLLEIADGSAEFIVESIGMFLQQTPELMMAIYDAIRTQDRAALTASAHKLKPNLGFFGMHIAQAMMQEIEHMAKNGDDFALIEEKYISARGIISPCLPKLQLIKEQRSTEL